MLVVHAEMLLSGIYSILTMVTKQNTGNINQYQYLIKEQKKKKKKDPQYVDFIGHFNYASLTFIDN